MIKSKRLSSILKKSLTVLLTASMIIPANVSAFAASAVEDEAIVATVGDYVDADNGEINEEPAIEELLEEDGEDLDSDDEPVIEETVDALEESISENELEENPEELTGAGLSTTAEVEGYDISTLLAPTNVKASFNKKNQIVLSWKKSKGAKGYYIYRMKADGTSDMKESNRIDAGKKTKYTDMYFADAETYAYKIMPYDESFQKGRAAYVVCAPSITEVKRRDDSNDPKTEKPGSDSDFEHEGVLGKERYRMNVDVLNIKGATGYKYYRGTSKKASSMYMDALVDSGEGIFKKLYNGFNVDQFRMVDGDDAECIYGKTYYYKAVAQYTIADGTAEGRTIVSAESAVTSGKVTERAPKEGTIGEISGSRIIITWEDMKGLGILSADDSYIIYSSTDGIKFSEYKTVTVDDLKVVPAGTRAFDGAKTFSYPTVAYTANDLAGTTRYWFKIQAIKDEKKGAKSDGNLEITTKVLAPKVKVKQSKDYLEFSWKKVKNATNYRIEFQKGVTVLDERLCDRTTVDKSVLKYRVEGLTVGEPVVIRVTTITDTEIGNYTELADALAPATPEIDCTMFNREETGAMLYMKKVSDKYVDTKNTTLGYNIYRSNKKDKGYELVEEFTEGSKTGSYYRIYDDTDLRNGKKVYYRIYSVAENSKYRNGVVESRSYDQIEYCMPSEVKDQTVTIGADDEAKSIKLSFNPSGTTMKEIESWYLAEGSSQEYMDELEVNSNGKLGDNKSNKYINITKVYSYNDHVGYDVMAPEIKIEPKGKTGKTYIKAKCVNGETATIKIVIQESTSESGGGNGKVIVLDPGHGGSDSGATKGNLREASLNLKISKYTKEVLEDNGYTVYMTRTGDSYVDLEKRVTMYKSKNPRCLVSQHINSASSGKGVECWYSITGKGKELAGNLCDYTSEYTGMGNRGRKTKASETSSGKDYYSIIRNSVANNMVGVIMENGFIQNDSSYMDSDDDLKKIAKGNAKGIMKTY